MNPTVLVIALIIVGVVTNRLIRLRFPSVSKVQIFCAISAWVAGTSLVVGRTNGSFWWYTGLFVSVVVGTFLIMTWLGPKVEPPQTS